MNNPSYPLTDFFYWIAHIFEDFFLIPIDYIRHWQDETWWGAQGVNFIFIFIFSALFVYWLYKLKIFSDYDKQHTKETHR